MIFKSNRISNQRNVKDLFEFIGDMNNMSSLMPEQVINIMADRDNFSFTVQSLGNLSLRVGWRNPYDLIQLVPVGKVPFQFILNIHLYEDGNHSQICVEIDANLNPIMTMMAQRPLKNLVEMMADRATNI